MVHTFASACLLFFVKVPRAGQVKTRLGRRLGMNNARRISMAMALDTLEVLSGMDLPIHIHFSPPWQGRALAHWLGSKGLLLPQQGNDLGERMARAFSQAFDRGYERALLMGSDIPDYPRQHLELALTALEEKDAVLNPSIDGGFCLIGFTRQAFSEELLQGLTWSHGCVLEQTAARLRQAGRSLISLPVWSDVDSLKDLYALRRKQGWKDLRSLRLLEQPCYGRPRGSWS